MFNITSAADFDRINYRAAALSMVAGVAHAIAMMQYIREWWGYGVFFILAALVQVMYGVALLLKPWQYDETGGIRASGVGNARAIYLAGLIFTVVLIVLYLITRMAGIPMVGPMAGEVEPFDPLSLLAQGIHVVLAVHLYVLARYAGSAAANEGTA
jgi:uncharacterized membrane protein YozB (DUF420 family)